MNTQQTAQKICAVICRGDGLKAREIAFELRLKRSRYVRLYADAVLSVCSGDMLFNTFDEYMGFWMTDKRHTFGNQN